MMAMAMAMAMETVISWKSHGDHIGQRQSRAWEIWEDTVIFQPRHLRKSRSDSASEGLDVRLTRCAPTLKNFVLVQRGQSIAGRLARTKWTLVELKYASFKLEDTILSDHSRPRLIC